MQSRDFRDIERQFYSALDALSAVLSLEERTEVTDFIYVGEYGVALQTLCGILVEESKTVSDVALEQLIELADEMGIRPTTTDLLRRTT